MGDIQTNLSSDIKLDDFQLDLAKQVLEQLQEYGQSGLEVMTSGGKSFIAAHIMYEYVNKHHDTKILWIAPKSAINNVRNKIFKNKAVGNNVSYIGYEELSRGNITPESITDIDKIGLIVMDECHKALARQTYKYLSVILDTMEWADRLAMSATPVRYGGVDTFKILVPKVTNPIKFDINDAGDHDLLPGLTYVLGNTNICASDFKTIERFKRLTRNNVTAEELYLSVVETLNSFRFDLKDDLTEMLKDYLHSSGENGERHIAFFRSIASLREMKDSIKGAFESAYPTCKVNILEYHSGMSDTENASAFQQFVVDEPEPKRIDVMLSVDKATESIHPDNIRSVMMFRGTNSVRVYLQQLGRGLMLKSYHPDDIVVFDLAENVSCLGSQSIFIGKKQLSQRTSQSNDADSQSIDDIKSAIMRRFGYTKGIGLTAKIGIRRISDCIDKLKEIERLANIDQLEKNINWIKRVFDWMVTSGMSYPTDNIHQMIYDVEQEIGLGNPKMAKIWNKDKESFDRFFKQFKNNFTVYQKMFLSDGLDVDDRLTQMFNKLGHSAYMTSMNRTLASDMMNDIDYIKAEIDKCGSIANSTNNHAKHKLKELRLSYAKSIISSSICTYARRNGIDIEMHTITMADISNLCETDKDKSIVQEYKPLVRQLQSIHSSMENGDTLKYADWLNIVAKLTVLNRTHRESEMGCICNTYIQNTYGYIVKAYKLAQGEVEAGNRLLSIVFKIAKGEQPNSVEEDYIFRHSNASGLSDYCIRILAELGISKREYVDKIERKTEFMRNYEAAMSGNEDAIRKMLEYNRAELDDKRKKLLNTTAFRQIKNDTKGTLGAEVLLKKAKLMYDMHGEYKKMYTELNDALKTGVIDQLDLALVPFKPHEATIARQVITCSDDEFTEMVESDQVNNLSILINRCRETASCSRGIMENIIKLNQLTPVYRDRLKKICEQIDILSNA